MWLVRDAKSTVSVFSNSGNKAIQISIDIGRKNTCITSWRNLPGVVVIPLMPALGRQRQADVYRVSSITAKDLSYTEKPCLEKQKEKQKTTGMDFEDIMLREQVGHR